MRRTISLQDIPETTRSGTTVIKGRLYDLAALVRDSATVDELMRREEEREEREVKQIEEFFAGLGWE